MKAGIVVNKYALHGSQNPQGKLEYLDGFRTQLTMSREWSFVICISLPENALDLRKPYQLMSRRENSEGSGDQAASLLERFNLPQFKL